MAHKLKAREAAQEGARVQTSAPKAGEMVQRLVPASFDVVIDSVVLVEKQDGEHKGNSKGVLGHLGCTTTTQARGLCATHGRTSQGVSGHPDSTTQANARRNRMKRGWRDYTKKEREVL